jgi:hypothetical protein
LGEHVEDLQATPAAQRPAHLGEGVEEGILGGTVSHAAKLAPTLQLFK